MPSLRDLLQPSDPMGPQARARAVEWGIMRPEDFNHGAPVPALPARPVQQMSPRPDVPDVITPAAPVPDQVRQLAAVYAQRWPADVALRMAWDAWRRGQARMR